METCTITTSATGATCGKPAVLAFGEFAECEEHARPVTTTVPAAERAAAPRFCRRFACVEEAMGHEFVSHLAGSHHA